MEIILIINALLALVENLLPKVKELADGGEITKEKQDEIRARYDKLAGNMDEAFGGDHWKVRPDPEPTAATKKSKASAKPTDGATDCND